MNDKAKIDALQTLRDALTECKMSSSQNVYEAAVRGFDALDTLTTARAATAVKNGAKVELCKPIGYATKQPLLTYAPFTFIYATKPEPENGSEPVALFSEDQVREMLSRAALTADASEQALDRRRCKPCAATRGGDNCWKCGTATFEPHPSCGDDPALPPIDRIRELAKEVGYAVGVHGSQQRDLDVIAAPWTDAAIGNYALMEHIAKGLTTDNGPAHIISTERKPLGRYAATIQMDGWYKQLDISVCAAAPAAPVADTGAVADAERIAHLEGEEEISEAVIATMSRLLASIAITLKGEEAALRRHSYHDLAELVKVMALELDLYKTIYGEKVPEGWDSATPASTATADSAPSTTQQPDQGDLK